MKYYTKPYTVPDGKVGYYRDFQVKFQGAGIYYRSEQVWKRFFWTEIDETEFSNRTPCEWIEFDMLEIRDN